jgi:hypothetical protein
VPPLSSNRADSSGAIGRPLNETARINSTMAAPCPGEALETLF